MIKLAAGFVALLSLSGCNWLDGKTVFHILDIYPETMMLKVGETQDLTVSYQYYDSDNPDHTVTLEDFKFTLTDDTVAKVELVEKDVEYDSQTYTVTVPRITALAPGEAILVVTVDSTSDTAVISVTENTESDLDK